jgi:hypothetical protein
MRILITGAKSAQAFAAAKAYTQDEILLADYGEVPKIAFKDYIFLSMGTHNPDTTAHSLLSFCLDHFVNAVIPIYDFEIDALRKSFVLFEEFDIQVILPNAV